jgi:hypothetical protein
MMDLSATGMHDRVNSDSGVYFVPVPEGPQLNTYIAIILNRKNLRFVLVDALVLHRSRCSHSRIL